MSYSEIKIKCSSCKQNNFVKIPNQSSPRCQYCDSILMEVNEVQGHVYVLSNTSMKGLVKVGYSERNVEDFC